MPIAAGTPLQSTAEPLAGLRDHLPAPHGDAVLVSRPNAAVEAYSGHAIVRVQREHRHRRHLAAVGVAVQREADNPFDAAVAAADLREGRAPVCPTRMS